MPYTMPTHIKIQAPSYNDRTRNAEQRETATTNAYNTYDSGVAKMYPDKSILTQGIRDAIKRQDDEKY